MLRSASAAAAGLAALLIAGCGDGSTATVSGTVTVDGQPLKEGLIRFVPPSTAAAAVEAPITNGEYTAAGVPLGEVQVQISAPKVVGKMKMIDTPESPYVDKVEELLPPRYNVQSELKMTVESGSQEKSFQLKSK
jgi:hypothetical protein